MEELSIEEKAKRYDEAIEIAKDCQYDGLALSQPVKDVIEHIFPELKEDERIKSCIKKCLSNAGEQVFDNYHIRLGDCLAWIEKQDNQVEQSKKSQESTSGEYKFKVGDWVVVDKSPLLIYDICDNTYGVKFEDDASRNYDVRVLENKAHLWSIEEDAKDGDVLVNKEGKPFIFSGHFDVLYGPTAYCGIDCENIFRISEEKSCWTHREVYPATKEQRDKIEKAMLDAGYKWNKEKLKLEKI